MNIELKLPDVGGEVDEVTITRWLINEGDRISEGDIILEVATDKVDTEVPAEISGILSKILVGEGELTPVEAVLAYVESDQVAGGDTPAPTGTVPSQADSTSIAETEPAARDIDATPVAMRIASEHGIELEGIGGSGTGGRVTKKDVLAYVDAEQESTPVSSPETVTGAVDPVVQRLAVEYGVDLREVAGQRPLSAITKADVLLAAGQEVTERPAREQATPSSPPAPETVRAAPEPAASEASAKSEAPTRELQTGEEFIAHSRNRTLTAAATTRAAQTIPHVTTWHDVNMTKVLAHRKAHKSDFAAAGVNLTVTAYLISAAVAGLKSVPQANSTWTDSGLIVKSQYNIGMAVALPGGGLIVPVIKNVDDLSLMGVARAINDLALRGREGSLKLADLQGGSFTVTNYGTSGSRFQTPIIVEGQAGILGVGAIEKRAVVVSQGHPLEANTGDYLAFLPMLTLGLSYDHRILDGATADAVCVAIKETLENWQ